MGRPRAFDEAEVLERAMRLFWEQGYGATSLDDLMRATGLSKQSLYSTFGGKRELFMKALALYRGQKLPELRARLEGAPSPHAAIAEAVRAASDPRARRDCPLGCLMANTALEIGVKDPEIAAEVRRMMHRYERLLAAAVRRGQELGEITTRFPSETIAQGLRNTLDGVGILQKAGAAPERIRAVVELALATIRA